MAKPKTKMHLFCINRNQDSHEGCESERYILLVNIRRLINYIISDFESRNEVKKDELGRLLKFSLHLSRDGKTFDNLETLDLTTGGLMCHLFNDLIRDLEKYSLTLGLDKFHHSSPDVHRITANGEDLQKCKKTFSVFVDKIFKEIKRVKYTKNNPSSYFSVFILSLNSLLKKISLLLKVLMFDGHLYEPPTYTFLDSANFTKASSIASKNGENRKTFKAMITLDLIMEKLDTIQADVTDHKVVKLISSHFSKVIKTYSVVLDTCLEENNSFIDDKRIQVYELPY